mmetsp:Transcript_17680/g.21677  ORF Transcript_17680/g.21677 Transcript_17680/m.21677 type:complete len:345 (+) Transcript_17680:19-1053(+)
MKKKKFAQSKAEAQAVQEEKAQELINIQATLERRALTLDAKAEEVQVELARVRTQAQIEREVAAADRALHVSAAAWATSTRAWAENTLQPYIRVLEAKIHHAEKHAELCRTEEREAQNAAARVQAECQVKIRKLDLDEANLRSRQIEFAEQVKKAQAALRRQRAKTQNSQLAQMSVSQEKYFFSQSQQEQLRNRRRRTPRRQPLRNNNTPNDLEASDEGSPDVNTGITIADSHFRIFALARGLEMLLFHANQGRKLAAVTKVGDRRRLRRVLDAWANFVLVRSQLNDEQYDDSWGVLALLNDDEYEEDKRFSSRERQVARSKAEEANYRARLLRGSILLPPADL